MSNTNKWRRDVRAGVEALGIEVLSIKASNSKHLKMHCRYAGHEWHQALSVSPSTPAALQMAVREARHRRDRGPHHE